MSDLAPPAVASALHTSWLGRRYRFLSECRSTNDEAASAGADAPEGLVVAADRQSGGRGRLGRAWHSPPGANLYVSLLLRPALPPVRVPPLTLLAGAVIAELLRDVGFAPRLKWPNDVQLPAPGGRRKVAGILTEMATERDRVRHVVLGIGLNVNVTEFPPELAAIATSLRLAAGRAFDRGAVLAALLDRLEPAYQRFVTDGPAAALERWRAHGALGERCRVERDGAAIEGDAVDLDAEGALLVRDATGTTHRIVSGEILVPPPGNVSAP